MAARSRAMSLEHLWSTSGASRGTGCLDSTPLLGGVSAKGGRKGGRTCASSFVTPECSSRTLAGFTRRGASRLEISRARAPLALTSSLSKQCPVPAVAQRRRGGPGQA